MANNIILQTGENEFTTVSRGSTMTLRKDKFGDWEMMTSNASTQAYNRGMPSFKYFASLEAVEAKYKSWRGIAALASDVVAA